MPRRGVTLVEMVVVIGTIGLMILMLLPALLGGADRARQVECQNDLKQISLGLVSYHHTFECFPPGSYSTVAADGRTVGHGLSWGISLLPFVEQTALGASLLRNVSVAAPENQTFCRASIRTFLCPSSLPPTEVHTQSLPLGVNAAPVVLARSSFVASFGTGNPLDGPTAISMSDGMFMHDRCVRIDDVLDGTSTTILVGERSPESGPASWVGVVGETGSALIFGTTGGDPGPNARPARATGYSSRHLGGANFAFGDGSVRFIKNGIGTKLYHALATRRGGEIVSEDEE